MNLKIKAFSELTRFKASLVSAAIILMVSGRLDHAITIFFFLLFSFAWNDLVDRNMDVDGHPERPLPSKRISPAEALSVAIILLVSGICFSLFFTKDLFEVFVIGCFISALYSWPLKHFIPSIATPVWVGVVTYVLYSPVNPPFFVCIAFFAILYAHDLLLDIGDADSDEKHCHSKSLGLFLKKNSKLRYATLFSLLFISSTLMELGRFLQIKEVNWSSWSSIFLSIQRPFVWDHVIHAIFLFVIIYHLLFSKKGFNLNSFSIIGLKYHMLLVLLYTH